MYIYYFVLTLDLRLTCSQFNLKLGFSSTILNEGYHFACSAQQTVPFQQIMMYILQCPHDINMYVHLLFCFDLDLNLTCPKAMFNLEFLHRSSLIGITLRVLPTKSCVITTNYHSCIAMPTRCRCAPPIYC